jgi:hypothetical protein
MRQINFESPDEERDIHNGIREQLGLNATEYYNAITAIGAGWVSDLLSDDPDTKRVEEIVRAYGPQTPLAREAIAKAQRAAHLFGEMKTFVRTVEMTSSDASLREQAQALLNPGRG